MNQFKKLIIFVVLLCSVVLSQKNNKDLTVEWIHSEEAKSISKVCQHVWLKNNTAILYDNRIPIAERDFKVLTLKNRMFWPRFWTIKKQLKI